MCPDIEDTPRSLPIKYATNKLQIRTMMINYKYYTIRLLIIYNVHLDMNFTQRKFII